MGYREVMDRPQDVDSAFGDIAGPGPATSPRFCDLTVFRAQAAVTREKHKNSRFCSWSFICCRDSSGGASFPLF